MNYGKGMCSAPPLQKFFYHPWEVLHSRDWCNPAHKTSSCSSPADAQELLLLIQIDLSLYYYIKGYFTSRLFSCHFSSLLCTFLDCIFMPRFSCMPSSDRLISLCSGKTRYRKVPKSTKKYRKVQKSTEKCRKVPKKYQKVQKSAEKYRKVQKGTERLRKAQFSIIFAIFWKSSISFTQNGKDPSIHDKTSSSKGKKLA